MRLGGGSGSGGGRLPGDGRRPETGRAGGRVGWFVSGLSRLSAAATACGRAARLQRELGQRAAAAWAAKGLGGGGCPAAAVFVPVLPQP